MKINIIGAGTWGTALAQVLAENKFIVKAWHHRLNFVDEINSTKIHPNLSPKKLDSKISFTNDLSTLSSNSPTILAVPTSTFNEILPKLTILNPQFIICASKGIEIQNGHLMSTIIQDKMGISKNKIVSLSGPSHAEEVFRKLPTALVSASTDINLAKRVQKLFSNNYFRVYSSSDIVGVEVGGAVKNIVSISCGICQGLGLGDNTLAALLTRGLQEIKRLGKFYGGEQETFSGLSGIGDLMVTAFSKFSRNRHVGFMIGKGKNLEDILKDMNMVAEGVYTTKSVYNIAMKEKLNMPICIETYKVLFNSKSPKDAINDLMNRDLINENH